jgi:two-component system response regulator ResD
MAKILIAEDDAHMLRILSMWLGRNGHTVVEASNGLEAKERLKVGAYDLLVSDVNMPGLDGIGLVRWLREEHGCGSPVVLLTSRCDQEVLAEELGCYDVHLHPKPFSPSRLATEIERQLKARRERVGGVPACEGEEHESKTDGGGGPA